MGKIIRAMDEAGMVRVNFIDSTDIVNRAQKIHMTSPVATAALGRTLSITAIMGSMLKGEADSCLLYTSIFSNRSSRTSLMRSPSRVTNNRIA